MCCINKQQLLSQLSYNSRTQMYYSLLYKLPLFHFNESEKRLFRNLSLQWNGRKCCNVCAIVFKCILHCYCHGKREPSNLVTFQKASVQILEVVSQCFYILTNKR